MFALSMDLLTTSDHGRMVDALDRALGALEWDLHGARRDRLVRDEQLSAAGDGAGFTYVLSGHAEIRRYDLHGGG